jgi:hypothetical protein
MKREAIIVPLVSFFVIFFVIYNNNRPCPNGYMTDDIVTHVSGVKAVIVKCSITGAHVDTGIKLRHWRSRMVDEFQ